MFCHRMFIVLPSDVLSASPGFGLRGCSIPVQCFGRGRISEGADACTPSHPETSCGRILRQPPPS
eukprot:7173061-Prymnesium_polylepis.1